MVGLCRDNELLELVDGSNVIGTESSLCNVLISGPSIADRHALIEFSVSTSQAIVSGIDPTYPIFLNGVRIRAPTRVVHGDTLAFGTKTNPFTSISASMSGSSMAASIPMFSKSMQQPLQSRVHPSFRNDTLMNQALEGYVERQLAKREAFTRKVNLSPKQKDLLDWEKLRVTQQLNDINKVIHGKKNFTDSFLGSVHEAAQDSDDESVDELPETLEKSAPLAPPAFETTPPEQTTFENASPVPPAFESAPPAIDDVEEEDDLPEMVDRATSPTEFEPPPPQQPLSPPPSPKPQRTASQQASIDQKVLYHRHRILSQSWSRWKGVLRYRHQKQMLQKQHRAAFAIQQFIHSYRLRQEINRRIQRRRARELAKKSLLRLERLIQKQKLRFAWRYWLNHHQLYPLNRVCEHIADTHARKSTLRKALNSWKNSCSIVQKRLLWLRNWYRQLYLSKTLTAFHKWQLYLLQFNIEKWEKKCSDEQAKAKALVLAMSTQTQAESNAWEQQAKETSEFLRKEAEAQQCIQDLRDELKSFKKDLVSTAIQTEGDSNHDEMEKIAAMREEQEKEIVLETLALKSRIFELEEELQSKSMSYVELGKQLQMDQLRLKEAENQLSDSDTNIQRLKDELLKQRDEEVKAKEERINIMERQIFDEKLVASQLEDSKKQLQSDLESMTQLLQNQINEIQLGKQAQNDLQTQIDKKSQENQSLKQCVNDLENRLQNALKQLESKEQNQQDIELSTSSTQTSNHGQTDQDVQTNTSAEFIAKEGHNKTLSERNEEIQRLNDLIQEGKVREDGLLKLLDESRAKESALNNSNHQLIATQEFIVNEKKQQEDQLNAKMNQLQVENTASAALIAELQSKLNQAMLNNTQQTEAIQTTNAIGEVYKRQLQEARDQINKLNETIEEQNSKQQNQSELTNQIANAAENKLNEVLAKSSPTKFISAVNKATHAKEIEKLNTHIEQLEANILTAHKVITKYEQEKFDRLHAQEQHQSKFNGTLESFLESLIAEYDLRLLRCNTELEAIHTLGEADIHAAQFRATTVSAEGFLSANILRV
ncbi:hypothetical protein THRCLA_21415 [Thraustotheca clavata]|uniref:FHA domain-containing protein n=1 Tax=Thraustotheca clavata TaxID=74557 RepID=A0A1V9ZWS2_9STRA|nr:hypothetical protein THRCLA_21415 [Thraustotheca clavata]